jgi:hypothetical protein
MAQAKQTDAWNHTSMIVAMLHNVNVKKEDQKQPSHFHPMIAKRTSRADRNPFAEAKEKIKAWEANR